MIHCVKYLMILYNEGVCRSHIDWQNHQGVLPYFGCLFGLMWSFGVWLGGASSLSFVLIYHGFPPFGGFLVLIFYRMGLGVVFTCGLVVKLFGLPSFGRFGRGASW